MLQEPRAMLNELRFFLSFAEPRNLVHVVARDIPGRHRQVLALRIATRAALLLFPFLCGRHRSLADAQRPTSTRANRYPAPAPTSTSSRSAGRQACRSSSLFNKAPRLICDSPVASQFETDSPTHPRCLDVSRWQRS